MKRTIIFAVALACTLGAQAQSVKELERAGFVRDSVAGVLAEYRINYARNENRREELVPTILSLEQALVRLQAEYDKILSAISQNRANEAVSAYEQAMKEKMNTSQEQKEVVSENKNDNYTPDKTRLKRSLVANDYFVNRLSATDYNSLINAQKREVEVKQQVDKLVVSYGELLSLQRQYMEALTREQADSLAQLFQAKKGVLLDSGEQMSADWSALYFNKIYAYDLLMEREGNNSMLDFSADATARAEREINENSDLYESNALVGYYARKKSLTEYELQLASYLSLTTSRDSLKMVAAELKNRDYRLSKLSLQRRSFIKYEDVDVKIPTTYTSKNPVPTTRVYDYGTIYRIRIGLFSKRPNLSALRGVVPLSYTTAYNNGMYAYFVGGFRTEQEAKEGVTKLKKLGFRDPIIAVWVDGEYYPTVEEMHRSQSMYNIEISGVATLTDEMKSAILSHKNDCTISRIGSTFVVGTFEGKSVAESIVAELKAINSEVKVEITKKP